MIPHRMHRPLAALLLATLSLATAPATAAEDFALGPLRAAPGERVSGDLLLPPRDGDDGTRIPVTVIHGARPGPVLALIAGTHGYEYAPITALQQLRTRIDPTELAGTLVLVHVANVPAFLGRTIYTSPADGLNLNRAYPGDPAGSISQRIAHTLTTEVIERSDYLIDLHAGDGNEALRPYIYMPLTGDDHIDAESRGLAEAFGLDTIVIDRVEISPPDASQLTDMTAWSRGIPAITTETGALGRNDPADVALAVDGVHNVLRHLGMVEGAPRPNEAIVWLEDYQVLRSPVTGVFEPVVRDGWAIAEQGLIGRLRDLHGEQVGEVRAPFAGVINYVVATPPVNEGDPVAMVSRVADAPPGR